MKTRLPSQALRLLWAFDFDGVVCHSAKELCITGKPVGQWVSPRVWGLGFGGWAGVRVGVCVWD